MNLTIRQNLTNSAITQYTNFFFDRGIVNVGGKSFALKCDALCLLGGNTDGTTDIDSEVQTGVTAFGDGDKRVRTIHVKGKFDAKDSITLKYDMDDFTPSFATTPASTARLGSSGTGSLKFNGVRSKFGEYLSVLIENKDGANFFINTITGFLINGFRK